MSEEDKVDEVFGSADEVTAETDKKAEEVKPEASPALETPLVNAQSGVTDTSAEDAAEAAFGATGSGMEKVDYGETRSRFPVAQYKGAEGRRDLICVLTKQIIIVKTHYEEDGLGRFFCFGGACCKVDGPPAVRYVIPIGRYDVRFDVKGKVTFNSNEIELMFLKVDKDKYMHFADLQAVGIVPNTKDFLVSCSDNKYQKIKFTTLEGLAAWRKNPQVQAELLARFAKNAEFIKPAIAKEITEHAFLAAHSENDAVPQQTGPGLVLGDMT